MEAAEQSGSALMVAAIRASMAASSSAAVNEIVGEHNTWVLPKASSMLTSTSNVPEECGGSTLKMLLGGAVASGAPFTCATPICMLSQATRTVVTGSGLPLASCRQ